MVFYLTPPTGSVSLSSLERICTVRFEYLKHLMNVNNMEEFLESTSIDFFVRNSDCLMEHNPSDKLSYFTLRMLSLQCRRLRALVEAGERRLLHYRLQVMSAAELRDTLLRTAARADRLRAALPAGETRHLLDTLVSVTSAAERHMAEHESGSRTGAGVDPQECEEPVVRVPFAMVAPLVAARSVSLSAGYGLLLCRHTAAALSCLQETVRGLSERQGPPATDDRLLPLLGRLRARLDPPASSSPVGPLPLPALDAAEPLLPPCMLALRAELHRRHRLAHRDRITLSAFLKDVGLTLEDNVRFWEREYSQPAGHGSACTHCWSRCQKRYLYSLRHMYGLEGRRVAFDSHSCQKLQERSGESLSSCGGCPFVGFDSASLSTLLTSEASLTAAEAAELVAADGAEPAARCRRYRELLLRRTRGERSPRYGGDGYGAAREGPGTGGGAGVRTAAGGVCGGSEAARPGSSAEDRGSVEGQTAGGGAFIGNCSAEGDLEVCEEVGVVSCGGPRGNDGSCAGRGLKNTCETNGLESVESQTAGIDSPGDELGPFTKPSEFFRGVLKACSHRSSGGSGG